MMGRPCCSSHCVSAVMVNFELNSFLDQQRKPGEGSHYHSRSSSHLCFIIHAAHYQQSQSMYSC